MKPYFIYHPNMISLGVGFGKLPNGKWDVSLSLLLITIGMQQPIKLEQKDFESYIESVMKDEDL